MLRVRIVPCARLARHSKINREGSEVTISNGGRVRDLLQEVGLFDEEVRSVEINGRRARLETSLRTNDVVLVKA